MPQEVPAPLVTEWRWWAAKYLQGAIAAEEVMGKDGERDRVLARVTAAAATLLPTKEQAGRAAAAEGALRLVDQAHWAEGWLHQLTGRPPRPVPGDDLENFPFLLEEILTGWARNAAEAVAENRADGYPAPTTAEITRSLTRAVLSMTDDEVFAPLARTYRELRVPVAPDGKGRYGRLDVMPGTIPDIVVEIDSAPNPASVNKLAFARDVGALPLWVRFGSGSIEKIDGISVLDLRNAVRGVRDAGDGGGHRERHGRRAPAHRRRGERPAERRQPRRRRGGRSVSGCAVCGCWLPTRSAHPAVASPPRLRDPPRGRSPQPVIGRIAVSR
ncbi:hypothetical protein [Streptomyces tricolor]|uniref:hypothetical protein n=1 Tax=Streptomyces tricolor TaxID=68277 RepID=UPI003D721B41